MNVTVELIAWNATNGPAVSHSSVYTIGALGSKQFLTFDLKDTLQEAGANASDLNKYFVQIRVRFLHLSCQHNVAISKSLLGHAIKMKIMVRLFRRNSS